MVSFGNGKELLGKAGADSGISSTSDWLLGRTLASRSLFSSVVWAGDNENLGSIKGGVRFTDSDLCHFVILKVSFELATWSIIF